MTIPPAEEVASSFGSHRSVLGLQLVWGLFGTPQDLLRDSDADEDAGNFADPWANLSSSSDEDDDD